VWQTVLFTTARSGAAGTIAASTPSRSMVRAPSELEPHTRPKWWSPRNMRSIMGAIVEH